MPDYTYNELMKMQNEAIKRVEDMQKRARRSAGLTEEKHEEKNEKDKTESATHKISKDEPRRVYMPNDYLEKLKDYATSSRTGTENDTRKEKTPKEGVKRERASGISDSLKKILGDINADSDKALILSLILLLSEEGADEMLIMALLYILT